MSKAPELVAASPPAAPVLTTVVLGHAEQGIPGRPGTGKGPQAADPWVKALFAFSQAVETKPRSPQPTLAKAAVVAESTPSLYSFADAAPQLANPLAPLRDRDRQALTEIFTHEHMVAIEADILARLSYLVPEPPWEVEPYVFAGVFVAYPGRLSCLGLR